MSRKTRRQLLGQHFLHEKRILEKIVAAADPASNELIIEIGAGQGVLTYRLANKAGRVLAVEKDSTLVQALEKNLPGNVEIIAGDILRLDLKNLIKTGRSSFARVKLVGNLPYHISSQVLFVLLEVKELVERAVFLFQKEVAERITALPGSKKYSPLSILIQNYFDCQLLFLVRPGAFTPPPKVDSACVLFLKRSSPIWFPEEEEKNFYIFLQSCFSQRRKTLVRNLESSGRPRAAILAKLKELGLPEKIRAEQLPPGKLLAVFKGLS